MINQDTLLRFFNVRKSEGKLIAYLILYSFCMGGAMAVYYTVVVSNFLTSFGSSAIPMSYIAGGVLVYFLGLLIDWSGKRITFRRQTENQLIFLVLSIIALTLGYQLTHNVWVVFALFIWNRVFVLIHGVTFWAAVSRVFDLQQSKRLYSLINSGEVVASVLAYLAVPLLINFMNPDYLLFGVILLLIACCVIQYFIHRNFLTESNPVEERRGAAEAISETNQKRSAYYRNLFLLASIPVFSLLYIEYLFFVESRESFPDREVLAGFLGLFFGVCAIFEAVIKAFLYHKLISRYGLKAGVVVLPALLIFSFALAVVYGYGFSADTIVFFAFIVMSRFFMSSVRKSVSEPAFQVLYQAVPVQFRLLLQNRIEGRAKSLAGLIAGVAIWLLLLIPGFTNTDFALVFLPVAVIWLILTLNGQKLYRYLILSRLSQSDISQATAGLSKSLIPTGNPGTSEVEADARLQAVRNLGDSERYRAYSQLIPFLQDASVLVRREAIASAGKLAVFRPEIHPYLFEQLYNERYSEESKRAMFVAGESFFAEIEKRFSNGADPEVVQLKLLDLLVQAGGAKAKKLLRAQLSNPNRHVTEKALIGLLNSGYRPNATESNRLMLLLEDYLRFYSWIIAVYEDLTIRYTASHTLLKALVIEREKLTIFIFSVLALLFNRRFSLISELIRNRESELRGVLLEICDIELSGQLKVKIKAILQSDFTSEILAELKVYYPQFHLSIEERLYELVNQDFTRLSLWTKALALKELRKVWSHTFPDVFAAFAVSPHYVLAQTAMYCLESLNKERYDELLAQFRNGTDQRSKRLVRELSLVENDDQLLVCRVSRLRFVSDFERVDDSLLAKIMRFGDYHTTYSDLKIDVPAYLAEDEVLVAVVTHGALRVSGSSEAIGAGCHYLQINSETTIEAEAFTELYLIPGYLLPSVRCEQSRELEIAGEVAG